MKSPAVLTLREAQYPMSTVSSRYPVIDKSSKAVSVAAKIGEKWSL
jgi:hypothetical protein